MLTRLRSTALVFACSLSLLGCGGAARALDPLPPAWPPAREIAPPTPPPIPAPSPTPERIPRPDYVEVVPGVHTRAGEAAGLGFLEVVLGDVDPTAALPMVVVIHGRGDRPRIPGGPFEALPRPVRLIMPRGPLILGEGFAWLPHSVAEFVRTDRVETLAAALDALASRLARLITQLRIERRTRGLTLVTGFSQGGMLAFTLAARHSEVVGVAFVLAGWLPPPLWPASLPVLRAPVRAIHGTADERIAIGPTLEALAHLQALGWDTDVRAFEGVGHEMTPEMNELYRAWLIRALAAIDDDPSSMVDPPPLLAPASEDAAEPEPIRERPRRRARPRPRRRPPRARDRR